MINRPLQTKPNHGEITNVHVWFTSCQLLAERPYRATSQSFSPLRLGEEEPKLITKSITLRSNRLILMRLQLTPADFNNAHIHIFHIISSPHLHLLTVVLVCRHLLFWSHRTTKHSHTPTLENGRHFGGKTVIFCAWRQIPSCSPARRSTRGH